MTDLTITVSLSLAQQAFLLDAITIWREIMRLPVFDYANDTKLDSLRLADELEELIGPIPAE